MINIDEVKNYLRIPFNDEDDYINSLIENGYIYLKNAVDNYEHLYTSNDDFRKQCDLWVKTQWMPTFYDQREGMLNPGKELNFVAKSVIMQLQTYKGENNES